MKRLLDESTDELTRSLLSAGVEHRPPAGNKAQVIMALGAGSALGLFSSNAFAWLGTTAGKVTAAGAAVGLAGAVFVAAASGVGGPADGNGNTSQALRASAEENVAAETSPAIPALAAPGATEPSELSEGREVSALDVIEAEADRAEDEALSSGERRSGTSSDVGAASEASGNDAWAKKAAPKKLSSRKRRGSLAERPALAGEEASAAAEPDEPAAREAAAAEASLLDTEVRLVDDMHGAARRNDRAALARHVEAYRESFPEGQLKKEVAEFEARLERSGAP